MSTYTSVREWAAPLRGLTLGVSIATLFLAPSTGNPVVSVEELIQKITSSSTVFLDNSFSPDGVFDLLTTRYPSPIGLVTPLLSSSMYPVEDKIESDSIPQVLRNITGLSVETLASLANVSRNAYYKWLDGRGVSDVHISRLTELLDTFRTLHDLLGSGLREFLEVPGPAGKPIDLLAQGDSSAVIGLALRPPSLLVDSSNVSDVARGISGLPGWLHPPVKLSWGAPRLTSNERDDVLDQLSPASLFRQAEPRGSIDEDDEAFVAWGFILE